MAKNDSNRTDTGNAKDAVIQEELDSAVRQVFGEFSEDILIPLHYAELVMTWVAELMERIRKDAISLDKAELLAGMADYLLSGAISSTRTTINKYCKAMTIAGVMSAENAEWHNKVM